MRSSRAQSHESTEHREVGWAGKSGTGILVGNEASDGCRSCIGAGRLHRQYEPNHTNVRVAPHTARHRVPHPKEHPVPLVGSPHRKESDRYGHRAGHAPSKWATSDQLTALSAG